MECSQVKAILYEYTDSEIPVEFRKDVEAHLAVCRRCAMQLEALREQSNALRTLPKVEAPADFLEQVRSRLEKPSLLSRLKNGLPVLFAGKHFFHLAGAAAAAVIVITGAQVILRDSGHKALLSPAPSTVGPPSPVKAPAASPAAKPHPPSVIEAQSVSLTLKLPGTLPKGKFRGGALKPESFSASRAGAGMRARNERSLGQDAPKAAARSAEVAKRSPPPETKKISSDVIELIERANGKILSAGPARDGSRAETLLAEMPSANYASFLDRLRQLGEVEFGGDKEFTPVPGAKVRVSVSFDTRD